MNLRILSLGAGVQSTAVALMAQAGEIPPLEGAIFADTGWEPPAVYAHLEWLIGVLDLPVTVVSGGDLRADAVAGGRDRFATLPFFLVNRDGSDGMLRRQCTKEYKIAPVRRELQRMRGGRVVELVYGISYDETHRMRESDVKYIRNDYPLVERRLTRQGCLAWMARHGYPTPPRSACVGCPYHSAAEWRSMKREHPLEWADAVDFDRAIRHLPRIEGEVFLHRQRVPLSEVDLKDPHDDGQLDLWGEECEGVCGV